jgi:UDP-4-amino-4,6-dideoxy-N-acetyl-beta-L-altrosamine transaminase
MPGSEPLLPYGRQTISEDDIAAVVQVLRSPCLTQGPAVPAFEQAVAARVGARHAVAANSATSALHIACLALGLGAGDRLWTSPITFVASANCARYCGADVDFVDIDPATGLISTVALAAKLEQAEREGALPKVVVPVHLCGTSCDMASIAALADRYGFAVLEDASHAIGGSYQDEPVGSCRHSAISVFSFHPVKIITTGEGGLATTNDPALAQRMADLRSHGITKDVQRFELPAPGPWSYEQQELGFNYRMTDLHAALGLSQLQRLDSIVAERQRLLEQYRQLLAGLPLQLLEIPQDVSSSLHLAVIRLADTSPDNHRRVFEGLRAAGIGVQLHYTPVHLQPYYRKLGFREGDYPDAELYALNAISLPLFPGLHVCDQQRVVRTLASFLAT